MKFSLFPAFFDHPARMSFIEQEHDETIILALRAHWITNIPWIINVIFASVLPPALIFLDHLFNINFVIQIPLKIYIETVVIWYVLIVAYIIEKFLFWYFNIYVVTNLHVIDINFYSLQNRDINEIAFNDIQNVSSSVKGVIGSLFYFGDIHIQTAAKTKEIDFLSVPKPDFVADKIEDLKEGKII